MEIYSKISRVIDKLLKIFCSKSLYIYLIPPNPNIGNDTSCDFSVRLVTVVHFCLAYESLGSKVSVDQPAILLHRPVLH